MAELLLVSNPKRRKRRGSKRRSRKGRMPPALKAYWAGKRRRKHSTKATRRRRRRSGGKRHAATGYTVGSRKIRRRKLNPHRRHHMRRRRRHNPSFRGITGQVMPTVKAGAWGAAGAIGLDALWGLVSPRLGSFSSYLSNPYVGFAAKAVGSVVVGTLGGKVFRGRSRQLADGAMTVAAHDMLKSLLIQMAPTLFGPGGSVPLGSYLSSYLSGSAPIVGTATIPQTYLPFNGTGTNDVFDSGVYSADHMGMNPWGEGNT